MKTGLIILYLNFFGNLYALILLPVWNLAGRASALMEITIKNGKHDFNSHRYFQPEINE